MFDNKEIIKIFHCYCFLNWLNRVSNKSKKIKSMWSIYQLLTYLNLEISTWKKQIIKKNWYGIKNALCTGILKFIKLFNTMSLLKQKPSAKWNFALIDYEKNQYDANFMCETVYKY